MARHGSTRRSLAAWFGRIVAAGAAGYLGFVTVEGSRRIVRPPRKPVEPTEEGAPAHPGDIGLAHEDVRFTTDDGYTLDGWLIPAGRETRAAVILMHGFSWHRLPWLTEFVPWIQPRYNILQFDFRGHGNSDDAPITLGTLEQRDVAAAVRFLQGRGYGPIALMGISMGGCGGDHGRAGPAGGRGGGRCRLRRAREPDRQPHAREPLPIRRGSGRGWWWPPPRFGRGRCCGSRSSGSGRSPRAGCC